MARILKARYQVKGPRREPVTYKKCWMDDLKSMQHETVTEEMDTYMVYFPQGHSIRITSYAKLEELGYHVKPRIVDMETGDVVEVGGDLYDFSSPVEADASIVLDEDDLELGSRKRKAPAPVE